MEKVVKDLIVARRYTILPDPENIEPTCGRNKDKEKFRLIARGKKKKLPVASIFFGFKRKNRRPRNQNRHRKCKATKFKSFASDHY